MEILSREFEHSLESKVLDVVSQFLQRKEKTKPRLLGIISRKELKEELGIENATIKRWEERGLKKYTPPVEDARTIFYKVDDVLVFLGVK